MFCFLAAQTKKHFRNICCGSKMFLKNSETFYCVREQTGKHFGKHCMKFTHVFAAMFPHLPRPLTVYAWISLCVIVFWNQCKKLLFSSFVDSLTHLRKCPLKLISITRWDNDPKNRFNPFTPKSAKFQTDKKIVNFILKNGEKQTPPLENTAQ